MQTSNDIAITQMQLSQQLSYDLLDRYKEAEQVLIPAWRYNLKLKNNSDSNEYLSELNISRERLIQALKDSLEKNKVK